MRREVDWDSYLAHARSACFVCELVAGRRPHHVVWEHDASIAFMSRYATLRGHSLGSEETNRHVHWHVAPLPPGVPFARASAAETRPDA